MAIKAARSVRLALVTCGTLREARRIARTAVEKKLAACASIVIAPAESVYRWKGRTQSAREHLILFKTTPGKLAQLERTVKKLHSYEVPEFIVIDVAAGSAAYLAWLHDSVQT